MNNLIEMVHLITARQNKSLEVFHPDTLQDDDSQYARFFCNIEDGTYQSDEDAAKDLYDSAPSDKRYQMLKSRVRKRLLNSLFFLDMQPPLTTQIGEAHYESAKTMIQASLLYKYGANSAAAELTRKNLVRARDIQMTEVEIFETRQLKRYLSVHGDRKEYRKLAKNLNTLLEVYTCEIQAENLVDDVLSELQKTGAREVKINQILIESISRVDEWRKKFDRFVLHKYYFYLLSIHLQLQKKFREAIGVSLEFERLLTSDSKLYRRNFHQRTVRDKLFCAVHLRDFENGQKFAVQLESLCDAGSNQWLQYVEWYLLLCIQKRDKINHASKLHDLAINSRRLKSKSHHHQEKWRIYKAYIDYALLHAGLQAETDDETTIRTTEDLNNFVRELPTYSKDKRGFYVSIIIVQVLFLLEWGNIDGIIDRIESIKRYIGRYLRRPEYHRSYCFMKLLLIMEKKNFDPVAVRKAGKRYYDKLTPSDNQEQSALDTLEIIPLDDLWVNILHTLERLKKQGTIV